PTGRKVSSNIVMSPQEPPKEPPPCEKPLLEACSDRVPRHPTRAFAKTAEPGKPVSQGVKDHLATSDLHADPTTADRRIPSPAPRGEGRRHGQRTGGGGGGRQAWGASQGCPRRLRRDG